jgi:hypothetical protein
MPANRPRLTGRKRARAAPSDRSPSRWQRARSPLSTGCPGPFHAQPPVQPDQRRRPPQPLLTPRRPRGRLDADAPDRGIAPNLTSLSVRLTSPGAGLSSNLPPIPAMSTTNQRLHTTHGKYLTTFGIDRGKCSRSGRGGTPLFPVRLPLLSDRFRSVPVRAALLSRDRENLPSLPSCTPWFRGMDHPTWRHEILSAPASAADAALPLRR